MTKTRTRRKKKRKETKKKPRCSVMICMPSLYCLYSLPGRPVPVPLSCIGKGKWLGCGLWGGEGAEGKGGCGTVGVATEIVKVPSQWYCRFTPFPPFLSYLDYSSQDSLSKPVPSIRLHEDLYMKMTKRCSFLKMNPQMFRFSLC